MAFFVSFMAEYVPNCSSVAAERIMAFVTTEELGTREAMEACPASVWDNSGLPQGPIALIHKGIRALVLETEALERGRAGLAPAISGMLCSGVRQEDIPPPRRSSPRSK